MVKGSMKRPHKVTISTRTRPEDRMKYVIPTIEDPAPHLIPDEESPTEEDPMVTVNDVFVSSHWRANKR